MRRIGRMAGEAVTMMCGVRERTRVEDIIELRQLVMHMKTI
jgi:hypothetical protein